MTLLGQEKSDDHKHGEYEYARFKSMQKQIHYTDTCEHATEDWILLYER
jgi:hypothetical protein